MVFKLFSFKNGNFYLPSLKSKKSHKKKVTISSLKVGEVINSKSHYMREVKQDCEKMLKDDHTVGLEKYGQATASHSNLRQQCNKDVCAHGQQELLDLVYQERPRSEVRCGK